MGQEFLEEVSAFAVFKKGKTPPKIPDESAEKSKKKKKGVKNKLQGNLIRIKPSTLKSTLNEASKKIKKIKKKEQKSVPIEKIKIGMKLMNGDTKSVILKNVKSISNTKNQSKKSKTLKKQSSPNGEIKQNPLSENLKQNKSDILTNDSVQEGQKVFERIIKPIKIDQFLEQYWEKEPCLIRKNNKNVFSHLMSFEMIDRMLRQHHIEFTKNIDITSYKNGVRETLNPEGRALPPDVWNFYNDGCSIRLLNPQTFLPAIYTMNATLQEFFHCMIGANVYLTPPNSQGFAPHYDDIEAFVLQIEGKKRWKVYAPRTENEVLPRFSSENLNPKEIGKPILEIVLEPGDVLYFPRGFIHQASTEPGHHSLHITLSMYQRQSYADLFEQLVPLALSKAITNDVNLRQGLPLNLWRNFGMIYSNTATKERESISKKCKELMKRLIDEMPLDDAVDQLAKKYQHDALPPVLSHDETVRTIFGNSTTTDSKGYASMNYHLDLNASVRLLRGNILRICTEDDTVKIYYYADNSREYHEYEANFIEIDSDNVIAVDKLIKSYPNYMKIVDLPLSSDDEKLDIVQSLWERGLLITQNPLS